MKKLVSLLFVMVMVLMLVACGGKTSGTAGNDATQGTNDKQGVSSEQKAEIDTAIYSENLELTTEDGKVVKLYYDPTVVRFSTGEGPFGAVETYMIDANDIYGSTADVYVKDAESAKAYVDNIIADNGNSIKIGEQEEVKRGGYTIHCYTLNDIESGSWLDEINLIEISSGVVFGLKGYNPSVSEDEGLENLLAAVKFEIQ